jgi:hypothetical protein
MASQLFANEITLSLSEGEDFEDFAFMFDTLVWLRGPIRVWRGEIIPFTIEGTVWQQLLRASADVAGALVCIVKPYKPESYVSVMRQFRLGFHGIASNKELQAEFPNCIRNAAIAVRRIDDIEWRPSLYFSLPERLRGRVEKWF